MPLNKVVIVEGPDGAGKTMLCAELTSMSYSWHGGVKPIVEHEGPPAKGVDPFTYYTSRLLRYLHARVPRVLDRFHLGETVYGPICRGESKMGALGVRLIDRLCSAYGVPIVVALPLKETCYTNWQAKAVDYVKKEEQFDRIYEAYARLKNQYVGYDYEVTADLVDLATILAEKRRVLPMGVTGSPSASVLLIGERPNGVFDLPFHALDNSSRYLNDALERAGLGENHIALVNAYHDDGRAFDLVEVASALPGLSLVVPLGNAAARAARRLTLKGLDVHPLPHPQYWKRFHAREEDAYIEMLREVKRVAF